MDKRLLVRLFVPVVSKEKEKLGKVGKTGTGYPVSPDLILTAAHVACPANRDPRFPIEVLWHDDPYGPRDGWYLLEEQDLIWRHPTLDAALLRCPRPPGVHGFGIVDGSKPADGAEWSSAGFPDVGKDEMGRRSVGFSGQTLSMSERAGYFEIDVAAAPDEAADWRGASGMPICLSGGSRIIGVAREVPAGMGARRLHAVPTWKLLQDPTFRSFIPLEDRQAGAALDEGRHAVIPPTSPVVIETPDKANGPARAASGPDDPSLGQSQLRSAPPPSRAQPSPLLTTSGEQQQPAGPAARQLRGDREQGLWKLENAIVKSLKTSKVAMEALTSTMPPSAAISAEGTRSEERWARGLIDALMNARPFETGKEWLTRSYQIVERADNQDAIDAIVNVSRHLIPWLYITSGGVLVDELEQVRLDDIVRLPAGLATFAEIVMAGIDRRPVQFEATRNPHGWPCSEVGVTTVQPESGLTDETDRNLRSDLFVRLTVPSEFALREDSEKDVRIQKRLEYFLTKEGIRYYWICNVPRSDPDKSECRELVKRIVGRYPTLAVIELDQALAGDHQDLFDDIRHLLRLVKP
jgi:hypothetical protein